MHPLFDNTYLMRWSIADARLIAVKDDERDEDWDWDWDWGKRKRRLVLRVRPACSGGLGIDVIITPRKGNSKHPPAPSSAKS